MDKLIKLITPLLAMASFVWAIYTYSETSRINAETRKVESAKPYLEKQLKLYTEATKVVAAISTSNNTEFVNQSKQRFLELYWGELGMVERSKVTAAMVAFKKALDNQQEQEVLASLSLNLAHACREELSESWNTKAWLK